MVYGYMGDSKHLVSKVIIFSAFFKWLYFHYFNHLLIIVMDHKMLKVITISYFI